MPSFIIVGYVWQILGREGFFAPPPSSPHPWAAPKLSIRNRVKVNKTFESHSTQENIIFQQYYQWHCDYLLKMGRMDEEQAVFEQLT